jgi:serine phosphatase RsbU (regulator of sigma subunit)
MSYMASTPVTSEFTQEFEAETGSLLRRRFVWFIVSVGVVYVMARIAALAGLEAAMIASAAKVSASDSLQKAIDGVRLGQLGMWIVLALTILDLAVIIWAGVHVHKGRLRQQQLAGFTQNVFLFFGVTQIFFQIIMRSTGFPWQICMYHLLACSFLPWTPRQAMRPIVPLLALSILIEVLEGIFGSGWGYVRGGSMFMTLFAAGPGVLISWIKHSRRMEAFRVRMLQTRYGQMRRELYDARRIHEALFPEPIHSGPLRFEYRYQPMLQIGGDYLYSKFSPSVNDRAPAFNLLLLDVTGHGIAAALTVNRLYGEVERLFAEDPHAGPGDVLTALNRYVHLTLATHSVYVTALCIRINQDRDTLEYASGGHPPAFLCSAGGEIDQLDSTSFVLGACAGSDFQPAVQSRPFVPGDALLAYTDGALECRAQNGRMLGVKGLLRILAESHRPEQAGRAGLASVVLAAVENHRFGPPEDDTLVVEITRAIGPRNSGAGVDEARERTTIAV